MMPREDIRPLLTLWRTATRREFVDLSADVLAAAAELTRFRTDDDQALVTDALGSTYERAFRAWLVAAKLCSAHREGFQSDLLMTWVALAAADGSGPGCLALLRTLALRATEGSSLRRVLLSWIRTVHRDIPDVLSSTGRAALAAEMRRSDPEPPRSDPDSSGSDAVEAEDRGDASSGPALKILLDGIESDWEFRQRFQALTKPLPLLGSQMRPQDLEQALTGEFPWLTEAIRYITDDLLLSESLGRQWVRIRPVLLIGPPGAGKTRLCRRLAELMNIPFRVVTAAGSSDNRAMQGTARGYSTPEPSIVIKIIAETECANPFIFTDEIDKAGHNRRNGSIYDTLLTLLEPETASRWLDECLVARADLSNVNWILTANSIGELPSPLLSRLSVVRVQAPSLAMLDAVLSGILSDIAREYAIDARLLPPLHPAVLRGLRQHAENGASIRELRAIVLRALVPTFLHG